MLFYRACFLSGTDLRWLIFVLFCLTFHEKIEWTSMLPGYKEVNEFIMK